MLVSPEGNLIMPINVFETRPEHMCILSRAYRANGMMAVCEFLSR